MSSKITEIQCRRNIYALALFPNAEYVLSGGRDGVIRRWRLSDGDQVETGINGNEGIKCIAVSADGQWIVTGSWNGEVAVWNARTEVKATEMKHKGWVLALDISPDSTKVVTASEDTTAAVWDIKTGRLLSTFKHSNWVWAVRFSPDNTRIATYEKGTPISIFDIKGKRLLRIQEYINTDFKRPKSILDWSSSRHLLVACKGEITCFDSSTGSIRLKWRAHKADADTFVITSRNGKFLVSWQIRSIAFWAASTFALIGPVIEPDLPIQSISLDHHGIHLAICGRDNKITVQDLRKILPKDYLPEASNLPQESLRETTPKSNSAPQNLKGSRTKPKRDDPAPNARLENNARPPKKWYFHMKQSKARVSEGKWEDAISEADMAISLDPSSPWGYDARRAALLAAGNYDEAFRAYEMMYLKLSQSPDPNTQQKRSQYVSPSQIEKAIHDVVQLTIRNTPRVLINTTTGRIWHKAQQAVAFAESPAYKKLRASMTTVIDREKIEEEVTQFYKYAMLSHVWEGEEPLLQLVENISIYELPGTLTNDKLRQFCKLMRDAGFTWVWSDTCCINRENQVVLQESIVAMFKWYRGSALTAVFLRGIPPTGSLSDSRWIRRGWTYQEYVASKNVRFYAENWTPYRNLPTTINHKEASEIISEMMRVTGALTSFARALEPGPENIREKLCLAATRQTSLVEDAAYSLLGIFSASIPVIYGEGESAAIGRLLGHLLTASGDASILAWTGVSGALNSCFPAQITVFDKLATSHLPAPLSPAALESIVAKLRNSSLDLNSVTKLYDILHDLPVPSFASDRIKLPCIMFEVQIVEAYQTDTGYSYTVDTTAFGTIEIETRELLSEDHSRYLIHPWLGALLGHGSQKGKKTAKPAPVSPTPEDTSGAGAKSSTRRPLQLPSTRATQVDKQTRALHLMANLRQPFGPLIVADMGQHYKRIATDASITVQVKEDMSVTDLINNARVIDVL